MIANGPDAAALVEFAVDELSVHDAAALVAKAGFAEDELVFVLPLHLRQAGFVGRNENDLVDRLAVVFLDGADGHPELHHLPPALGLAVGLARLFGEEVGEPLDHFDAAIRIVPHFQCALGPACLQRRPQAAHLLRLHGEVHQDLSLTAHIAACRADEAVEPVVEERCGHPEVPSGAEKELVPVGAGTAEGLHRAVRHGHLTRRQQGAVDIQKDQFLFHFPIPIQRKSRPSTSIASSRPSTA